MSLYRLSTRFLFRGSMDCRSSIELDGQVLGIHANKKRHIEEGIPITRQINSYCDGCWWDY